MYQHSSRGCIWRRYYSVNAIFQIALCFQSIFPMYFYMVVVKKKTTDLRVPTGKKGLDIIMFVIKAWLDVIEYLCDR